MFSPNPFRFDENRIYWFFVHLTEDKKAASNHWRQFRKNPDLNAFTKSVQFAISGKSLSFASGLGPTNLEDRALWLIVDFVRLPLFQAAEMLKISEDAARARIYRIRKTLLKDESTGLFASESELEQRSLRLFSNFAESVPRECFGDAATSRYSRASSR